MGKKEYGKTEWQEFQNEILELVILYNHVKEYAAFDKEKIKYIESFFHLSRKQAITSFFIKVGFLVTDGRPTFKDFLKDKPQDYENLISIYNKKVGLVRNKFYAHNAKNDKHLKNFSLTNKDVEELYVTIISLAKEIDEKYEDHFSYDLILNTDGIKSLEYIIDKSIEFYDLKKEIIKLNYTATVELNIMNGKIKIVNDSKEN